MDFILVEMENVVACFVNLGEIIWLFIFGSVISLFIGLVYSSFIFLLFDKVFCG